MVVFGGGHNEGAFVEGLKISEPGREAVNA